MKNRPMPLNKEEQIEQNHRDEADVMKVSEIIHLRSTGEPIESLGRRIRESIAAEGKTVEVVTLYRRQGLHTDLAVHIQYPVVSGRRGPSDVALHLAEALGAYGLVEHTVWEELP